MNPNCIWLWKFGECGLSFHSYYFQSPQSMSQRDLFKNYSYSIGLCAKKSEQLRKKGKYNWTVNVILYPQGIK